jgi:hypothetical protein
MNMRRSDRWPRLLQRSIKEAADHSPEYGDFARANANAVETAIAGRGPDEKEADPEAGARMVVNMAAVHIPAFCEASRSGDPKPYMNKYDLEKKNNQNKKLSKGSRTDRIGEDAPKEVNSPRQMVDNALPLPSGRTSSDVYFGAVELNGAGIRFYGDVCLVLKRGTWLQETVILDRNSYDLIRPPISTTIEKKDDQAKARAVEARRLSGSWDRDLPAVAALKAFQALGSRTRRYTTGQISEAVREDEDYIEVLRIGSFGSSDLQEARVSAAEAAHDALAGDRLFTNCPPRLEALMWRQRRRRAEEELRRSGITVRVVTTSGRTKD